MNGKMNKFFRKTPFFVTLLGVVALTLMALNAVRFGTALVQWHLILDFMPNPGPAYIAVTGLLWAVCWLTVYIGIELARKWGGVSFLLLSFLYASYYWLDRFFFQSHAERSNALFVFIVTFLFLVGTIAILALPKSREYFANDIDVDENGNLNNYPKISSY